MIKFSENNIQKAIAYTADIALAAAKEVCPVRTGRLKNSISCSKEKSRAVIYTDVPYAAAVELGTSRQKPKPYLSRGIDEAAKMAGIIFKEELFR